MLGNILYASWAVCILYGRSVLSLGPVFNPVVCLFLLVDLREFFIHSGYASFTRIVVI